MLSATRETMASLRVTERVLVSLLVSDVSTMRVYLSAQRQSLARKHTVATAWCWLGSQNSLVA